MNDRELRRGNLIMDRFGEVVTVEGVMKGEVLESGCWDYLNKYKPIILTEEWLVNSGFEKKKIQGGFHHLFLKIKPHFRIWARHSYSISGAWTIHLPYNYPEPVRQYAHQIQNLYHSLTGEELIIKQ